MKDKRFKSALKFTISMMMASVMAIVVLFATLLNNGTTYAAPPQVLTSEVMLPMVAFADNELSLFGFSPAPQVIDGNSSPFMSNHVWSPNGNLLAYIATGANGNQLMLTDILGRTPYVIATGLNSGQPVTFSDDSSQLIYAIVPDPNQATSINGEYTVDIMSKVIGSANDAVKLGSFKQASCGGGGPSVYDALYWMEAGQGGTRPILAMTPAGLVHSTTCYGVGVSLLNTITGEDTVLDADITRVSVSADGKLIVGVKNNQLTIIDIATGEIASFDTDEIPDQVIWGVADSGNIYYSVRVVTDEIISYTAAEQQKINEATGLEISDLAMNQVAIHRLNLETGIDEIVYENTAYAIGHMTLLPDNRMIMVSEIPSLAGWFEMILTSDKSSAPQLETALYIVSLEDAETRLLGHGLSGARLNKEAYVRIFGISPQITVQPVTVSAGTQVKVTGTNFPLQSRVMVYLGTNATNLDEKIYASGFTQANGEITLSFNLPAQFEDGKAIANGQIVLVAETADGLFSAQATLTVNTATSAPTVNIGLPTPAQVAAMSISPDNGTVGTQININGSGFPANQRVNVHMGNVTVGASNAVYASSFSNASGNISLTFNMPSVYADGSAIQGPQLVIVVATDNFSTSGALVFNYTPISQPVTLPSISLSPTTVKVTDKVTVRGTNFAPNTSINILIGPNANDLRGNYRTVTSDANGNFDTSFKMPARWSTGSKIKAAQVVVVAVPNPTGTSASATLGIKYPSVQNNNPTPVATQEPVETEEPVETQEPVETEEPVETQEPVETEEPVETQEPVETEEPVETQEPVETEEPIETEEPVETENPTVNELGGSVQVGNEVIATGGGFAPNSAISLFLSDDARTTNSIGAVADENGDFSITFNVPGLWGNDDTIEAGTYSLVVASQTSSISTSITIE